MLQGKRQANRLPHKSKSELTMNRNRLIVCAFASMAVWAMGCLTAAGQSVWPDVMLDKLRTVAIQHNGRNKPLDSFAREMVRQITGQEYFQKQDPLETVLSIIAEPERWQAVDCIAVSFVPLREALGMDRKAARISYNDLVASRKLMRMLPAIVEKQDQNEKLTLMDNEVMDTFQRFVAFSNLINHRLALLPPPAASSQVWLSIEQPEGYTEREKQLIESAWSSLLQPIQANHVPDAAASAFYLSHFLPRLRPQAYPAQWRLYWEVFYNRIHLFDWARLFYLLAAAGLLVGLFGPAGFSRWARTVSMGFLGTAFFFHLSGIALRVILGGRPPVSNFFETMLWLPFVGVVIALVYDHIYRNLHFGLAASLLAVITLSIAENVPLDSSLVPVVAVLRSNLWLTIHVLTIVASYGALALATCLAHIYAAVYLRGSKRKKQLKDLGLFLYRVLQVGVVLLAGGIMLGAVWANASWGRYWGWDPKETWALITLLWYLALLHGRFAGWIRGVGVALATIGGFFLLLMTYYGVSFYLVGLHSYAGGHAKPLPVLLVTYLAAEAVFLLWVGFAARRRSA